MSNARFGLRTLNGKIENLVSGLTSYDADVQAFIGAANITDNTQKEAIRVLVQDLKSIGVWTKMRAIYPFVGGTATAHSVNLKNPSLHAITWAGGMIHDSNGITGNGVNAAGSVGGLAPSNLPQNSAHISIYNRTNNSFGNLSTTGDIGTKEQNGTSQGLAIDSNGSGSFFAYSNSFTTISIPNYNNALGFSLNNRISNTQVLLQRNNIQSIISNTATITHSLNFQILRVNPGFPATNVRNLAFITIGDGLTDTESLNLYNVIQTFQTTLGRAVTGVSQISADADVQAFVNTASITNTTQANAVNTLVTNLKNANLWTKFKAIYPFVGGSSGSHSINLKNPTQYQITWFGGVTHDSNGITGNGSTGYGDTFLNDSVMSQDSLHVSIYSRTNFNGDASDIAAFTSVYGTTIFSSVTNAIALRNNQNSASVDIPTQDSLGFYLNSRTVSNQILYQKNNAQGFITHTSSAQLNASFKLLRRGNANGSYSPRNLAFATIGDGLTESEGITFYNIVQAYQTSLGRAITPSVVVADSDVQSFINTANITDSTQISALSTLVTTLKSIGVWNKMKAVYPFVGGTATTHSFNLKNVSQYRITWFGGVTHNSNGITGNNTNAYGDTGLPNNTMAQTSNHFSIYSKTDYNGQSIDIGSSLSSLLVSRNGNNVNIRNNDSGTVLISNNNSLGLHSCIRNDASNVIFQKNNTLTSASNNASNYLSLTFNILRATGYNSEYSLRNLAFCTIGDGLTNTEATNLYSAIQTFQTTLNRQV